MSPLVEVKEYRTRWAGAGEQLLDQIESRIEVRAQHAVAQYEELTLESAFQPIISLAHGRAVGYEALVRAFPGRERRSVPPADVFQRAKDRDEAVLVDGLCRALHLVNFELQRAGDAWVFVNMTPSAILAMGAPDPLFPVLLNRRGIQPHQVVIEILESKTYDERMLAEVVEHFRQLGCLVALDDFGAGQSNFERIWRISPDVVKLDRSMVEEATRDPRVRRILPGLVGLLHEAGCLVVMEGIETEEQALIAMEMDVDFVQGFYFGRPDHILSPPSPQRVESLGQLFGKFRKRMAEHNVATREALEPYTRTLERAALLVCDGVVLEIACVELLQLPCVDRCYLLDADGVQVGKSTEAQHRRARPDPRYLPFANCEGANWGRRPYFRRAITRPKVVQISQPYLSMSDAKSCMTLSISIEQEDTLLVLCVDLDWVSWESSNRSPMLRPAASLSWSELESEDAE